MPLPALSKARRLFDPGRGVALAVLVGFLGLRLLDPPFVEQLRLGTFDLFQKLAPRESTRSQVVIVDIDEESLVSFGQWPWPRFILAQMIANLTRLGARVVGFDVMFPEPDRTSAPRLANTIPQLPPQIADALRELPDNDAILAEAMRHGRVVLGQAALARPSTGRGLGRPLLKASLAETGGDPRPFLPYYHNVTRNVPPMEKAAAGAGMVSLRPEVDGVVRRVPAVMRIGDDIAPTLAIEMVRVALGQDSPVLVTEHKVGIRGVALGGMLIPTDNEGNIWINNAPGRGNRYVSARVLVEDQIPAERIANKFVLVGSSAPGLHDVWATPMEQAVPGVEAHAQIIETILAGAFLDRPHNAIDMELTFVAVAGIMIIFFLPMARPLWSLPILSAFLGAVVYGAWYAFSRQRVFFDPSFPVMSFIALYLQLAYVGLARADNYRREIRTAFRKFLAPTVVERIAADPSFLKLGGEARHMTFLFTDVADFTPLTEKTHAGMVVKTLNEYLDGICHIVMEHGGTVDKIVGDAVHAMFNAPLDQADHAERAVACALAVDAFGRRFSAEKTHEDLVFGVTRIGVNTGFAIVGNFGGESRFDYTAHGDAVNTAARLESLNKRLGTHISVSGTTARRCQRARFRPVGNLILPGKAEAVEVFEPLGEETAGSAMVERYNAAFELLRSGEASASRDFANLLAEYPDDPLTRFHAGRLGEGKGGIEVAFGEK